MKQEHVPVLLHEVIEHLQVESNHNYIDGTLGAGGHAQEILKANSPQGKLLGIDLDEDALQIARKRLESFGDRAILVRGSYTEMDKLAHENGIEDVHGVLLDLGMSSMHIDSSGRGFSFQKDEPLDMRFGKGSGIVTARDIVNGYAEKDLVRIFKEYGQERYARKIATTIVTLRKESLIETTQDLVSIVEQSVPRSQLYRPTHCATKVFQALRIETNDEFTVVHNVLYTAVDVLAVGGRLAVITFHSLEDTLVKKVFKELSINCICPPDFPVCACDTRAKIKIINKRVIIPTEKEVSLNPRSRSAKLRIVEKI